MLNLKQLAFDLGLNQGDIGRIVGLPQSQVSLMMNGRRNIRKEYIERLRQALGDEVIEKYYVDASSSAPFTVPATILPTAAVEEAREEGQASMIDELRELLAQQRILITQQGDLITQLDDAGKRVDKLIALLDK